MNKKNIVLFFVLLLLSSISKAQFYRNCDSTVTIVQIDTVYGVAFAADRSVTCYRIDTTIIVSFEKHGYRNKPKSKYYTLDYHEEVRFVSGRGLFIKAETIE